MNYRLFSGLLLFVLVAFPVRARDAALPRLETYITAEQVEPYFSTEENRWKAIQVYQNLGITKVYLESLRSGYQPSLSLLREVRDFLREHGIEVSGGITTTAGENFGTPSNRNPYWLNYQDPKTRNEMADHIRKIALLFDEIIVDDFLATDDESPQSEEAKGNRSWSEYRLQVMADFARRFIIQPARETNPQIRLIEKFPQWYDRFHVFGYNANAAPQDFDRIWVGTETRNPETARFGYVMPTEGYINYRWLASIAGDKIGGGWFDFGDCTPQSFLMQAYQSVLAGAKELVLFESSQLINRNECIEPFLQRREALFALGDILQYRHPIGMFAYKPIHSEGSDDRGAANLYVFDYLATLGLAPLPVSQVPQSASCIFLARQAACDPTIQEKVTQWLHQGVKLVVTPDFLRQIEHPALKNCPPIDPETGFATWDVDKGSVLILDIKTFGDQEFSPEKEMFLPPKPLPICQWSAERVNRLRHEILPLWGVEVTAPNQVGIYLFDENLLILANFNDSAVSCEIETTFSNRKPFQLHPQFPHAPETHVEGTGHPCIVRIAPWEIVVLESIQ